MDRIEMINEIIRLQTEKSKVFIEVAKREDLEKLSELDLNMIYAITKHVKEAD